MMIKIRNTLPLVCRRTTSSPFQLQDNQDQQASQQQKTSSMQLFHVRGSPKDRTKGSKKDSSKWDHQWTHQKCAKMSKPNEPTIGSQNDPTKGPHLSDYHDTLGFRQMELWLGNRLGAKIWRRKKLNQSSGCLDLNSIEGIPMNIGQSTFFGHVKFWTSQELQIKVWKQSPEDTVEYYRSLK